MEHLEIDLIKSLFSEMGVLMYGNPLSPLVPAAYPPYVWHHFPSFFLPYSPLNRRPDAVSPERATSLNQRLLVPEKTKIGE